LNTDSTSRIDRFISLLRAEAVRVVLATGSSAGLYVILASIVGSEPWDTVVYRPMLFVGAVWATLVRPRFALSACVGIIFGQLVGWGAYAVLSGVSLAYWPLVAFLTIPLFVAPVIAFGGAIGAVAGLLRHRRAR
jgi:hypothetical protein